MARPKKILPKLPPEPEADLTTLVVEKMKEYHYSVTPELYTKMFGEKR